MELPEEFHFEKVVLYPAPGTEIYRMIARLLAWFQNQKELRVIEATFNGTKVTMEKV